MKVTNYIEALQAAEPDHEGTLLATLIDLPETGMVIEKIPADKSVAPHYHKAGNDFFLVLSGRCVLYIADIDKDGKTHLNAQRLKLKAGDAYSVPPNVIHSIENPHNEEITIINVAPKNHLTTDTFDA